MFKGRNRVVIALVVGSSRTATRRGRGRRVLRRWWRWAADVRFARVCRLTSPRHECTLNGIVHVRPALGYEGPTKEADLLVCLHMARSVEEDVLERDVTRLEIRTIGLHPNRPESASGVCHQAWVVLLIFSYSSQDKRDKTPRKGAARGRTCYPCEAWCWWCV